jgi:uncharacterized membrane protein YjjP (DUF1212 family)
MPGMDEAGVRRILDVALRLGQLLLGCQAGAADVATTIGAVTAAYGLPDTQVDITVNSVTVSVPRGVPGAPVTAMHMVESRSLDYSRLQLATDLAQHVVETTPEPEWVQEQLNTLERAEHPYPRWVSTVAWGVMAGAVSFLFGGGALVALTATVTTALIDRVGRVLNGWHAPILFQQAVGAAIATGVTVGLEAIGQLPAATSPSVVVASNIVVLLSGLAIVGSAQDAISGYQLTAAARIMDIMLSSAGILIGVTVAVRIGVAVGMNIHVRAHIPVAALGIPVLVLAGGVASAAAAIASYAPARAALVAGAAGATGSLLFLGMTFAGAGQVASAFVSATAIGFAGAVGARRAGVPPLVIVMAGIVPEVPGLTLFRGFFDLVTGQPGAGVGSLGTAATTALALGAGVVFGPLFAPSIQRELGRFRGVLRKDSSGHLVSWQRLPHLAGISRSGKRRS